MSLTPVSPAMVLAKVDEAVSMDYRSGIIGLRGATSDAVTADLQHQGRTVRVRAAESALAAREVIAEHRDGDWMVVVTDRDDDDLGAGILAHFVWQRLRNPDPWEAVRHRFAATGIDPLLTTRPASSDLATDLVAATPPDGWPPAPAGVLTRAHTLGAVAAAHLGYEGEAGDPLGVLRWTMSAEHVTAVAALRHGVGDRLTDAALAWIAESAGPAARPVASLLARGELADVVPLGVVLHLLTSVGDDPAARHQAQLALVRLEPRWGEPRPSDASLAALGRACDTLLAELVHDRRADADVARVLRRGDDLLAQVHATGLAQHSDLLASGLRARLVVLADALRRAVGGPRADHDPGAVDPGPVELGWRQVTAHRLATPGAPVAPDLKPFAAAVRLTRWLARPEPEPPAAAPARLTALASRHLGDDAWADAAFDDAFRGVDDPDLSPALQAVAASVLARRRDQERRFAQALAAAGTAGSGRDALPADGGGVWYLERLLPGAVIPLARQVPVLLLVMDGMSAATATEILDDATRRLSWTEAALPGATRRGAALAVLPTLTEVSRASLLCGRLTEGQQAAERAGYADLTAQTGKIRAALFHKKGVDTTAAGWSVSQDVGAALDDPDLALVTVVLNTVDDALDRSDPAGTVWTADAVKHLEPLLARAAAAGRVVVMTADHGHVVERRLGRQVHHQDFWSGRSRSPGAPAGDGEVEVSGPRVLAVGQRAVLAVDADLRYGPLKAGYHGGASAAEVVVPVAVLAREDDRTGALPAGLVALPPQQPDWWDGTPVPAAPPAAVSAVTRQARRDEPSAPGTTLFDLAPPAPPVTAPGGPGRAVVRSAVYRGQRKLATRVIVTDEQVARLVDALAAAPGARLAATPAAQALGVPQTRLSGALTQVQQLLNVEGYPVLARDAATGVAVLDVGLLGEQFGVLT